MRKGSRLLALMMTCFLGVSMSVITASGETSYLYDVHGKSVPAPEAYCVKAVYKGIDFKTDNLQQPQDIFVDVQGNIYIADTDNNRIVILNDRFELTKQVTEVYAGKEKQSLYQPKGVFKDSGGLLYICDTGNSRVIAVNDQYEIVRMMTNENVLDINSSITFSPEKVVADSSGNVFVVDPSIYQGILQYNRDNAFVGFFAPNEVDVTADVLFLQMWKKWFSSEQVEAMERNLPSPYSNLYIDNDNFLYASSANAGKGKELKRLNNLGMNILQPPGKKFGRNPFGDQETSYEEYVEIKSRFVDIYAEDSGILCGADASRGRMFLYDQDCNLIAIFGGKGDNAGTFNKVSAIDKLGEDYLVLDSEKGSVTVFSPTPYMHDVLSALTFYNAGKYVESVDMWKNILKQNSHFSIAYKSIGRAYFQQGNSAEAMKMLKQGDDPYFYSMALKEYRKTFVRQHFVVIVLGIVVGCVGLAWILKRLRRWMLSLPSQKSKTGKAGVK